MSTVHGVIQTARGYLTDEDYFAVEAALSEAVELAKDVEAERDRYRAALTWIAEGGDEADVELAKAVLDE